MLQDKQDQQVQEAIKKIVYDSKTDTLALRLKTGPVAESDEDKIGVMLDYDSACNILSIEILEASKRVKEARSMQFEVAA